jgi:hypothetical protein
MLFFNYHHQKKNYQMLFPATTPVQGCGALSDNHLAMYLGAPAGCLPAPKASATAFLFVYFLAITTIRPHKSIWPNPNVLTDKPDANYLFKYHQTKTANIIKMPAAILFSFVNPVLFDYFFFTTLSTIP